MSCGRDSSAGLQLGTGKRSRATPSSYALINICLPLKPKQLRSTRFNEAWLMSMVPEVTHQEPHKMCVVTILVNFCRVSRRTKSLSLSKDRDMLISTKSCNGIFGTDHVCRHMSDRLNQLPEHSGDYSDLADVRKWNAFKVSTEC